MCDSVLTWSPFTAHLFCTPIPSFITMQCQSSGTGQDLLSSSDFLNLHSSPIALIHFSVGALWFDCGLLQLTPHLLTSSALTCWSCTSNLSPPQIPSSLQVSQRFRETSAARAQNYSDAPDRVLLTVIEVDVITRDVAAGKQPHSTLFILLQTKVRQVLV